MKQQLELIRESAKNALETVKNNQDIENVRIRYLGKKGELTSILKKMGKLTSEERPIIGKLANDVRSFIEEKIGECSNRIKNIEISQRIKEEKISVRCGRCRNSSGISAGKMVKRTWDRR